MTSAKAGAASLTKVRRPAAPVPASKHNTGVPESRRNRADSSSVSRTASACAFAVTLYASLVCAVVIGGLLAFRYPLAATAIGLAGLFVGAVLMVGRDR